VFCKEECHAAPTSGYDTDTYLAIQGGKLILPEFSGTNGVVVNDGDQVASFIGTIYDYHPHGMNFWKAGAGFGKTLQLKKGDVVSFDAGQKRRGASTAYVQYDLVGGISYVGK